VKGRRKGQELAWKDLVSGDAALAVALNATLAQARGGADYKSTVKRKETEKQAGVKKKTPATKSARRR